MQCYFLSPDNGLGNAYAQQQSKRMEAVSPHHPLLDLVYGVIEYDRSKSEISTEQIIHGAAAIRTSRLLSVHSGKLLIHAGRYEAAKNILESSYKIDTTASLPLFYLAVAESQLSNDYAKMENYLVRFLSDPKIRMLQRSMMIEKGTIEYAEKMLSEVRNAKGK